VIGELGSPSTRCSACTGQNHGSNTQEFMRQVHTQSLGFNPCLQTRQTDMNAH